MTTNNQLVILDKTSYINNKNVSNVFNIPCSANLKTP